MKGSHQGLGVTESRYTGVRHTDPRISFPEASSVSTSPSNVLNKAPTENDINELLTAKWTLTAGLIYPTNKQNMRYNERWEAKYPWLRYSLIDGSAFCAKCIAFSGQISETTPEFINDGFRDWTNIVGEKTGKTSIY